MIAVTPRVPRRRRSPHQVRQRYVEASGKKKKVVEVGRPVRVLPAADALHVSVDELTEFLLGDALRVAGLADLRTDGPGAGENPVGRFVTVHATKLE